MDPFCRAKGNSSSQIVICNYDTSNCWTALATTFFSCAWSYGNNFFIETGGCFSLLLSAAVISRIAASAGASWRIRTLQWLPSMAVQSETCVGVQMKWNSIQFTLCGGGGGFKLPAAEVLLLLRPAGRFHVNGTRSETQLSDWLPADWTSLRGTWATNSHFLINVADS